MNMNDVARSTMKKFRTLDGRAFMGSLSTPDDNSSTTNFEYPRRFLRTGLKALVQPGDIMLSDTGRRYLLAAHPDHDTPHLKAKMFRCFEVDRQVAWERVGEGTDPVTGLKRDGVRTPLGQIWCAMESPSVADQGLQVNRQRFRVITNAELQLNDIVDGRYKVVVVRSQLGIVIAEVE